MEQQNRFTFPAFDIDDFIIICLNRFFTEARQASFDESGKRKQERGKDFFYCNIDFNTPFNILLCSVRFAGRVVPGF